MPVRFHIFLLLYLTGAIFGGCASLEVGPGDEEFDAVDTLSDSNSDGAFEPTEESEPQGGTGSEENRDLDTGIEKDSEDGEMDTSSNAEEETERESEVDTDPHCSDTNPDACGALCISCQDTNKPYCMNGTCVQCIATNHCEPGESCDNNICIDRCSSPATACTDVASPYCSDSSLVTSSVDACDSSTGTVTCTYKQSISPCPYGCSNGRCSEPTCFYDENNDGLSDVIEQPHIKPKRCWRRCVLPTTWNGTACIGTELEYTRPNSATECGARGYRIPTAAEYTGPAIANGILNNCVISGPQNLDWKCDSCSDSAPCALMFGNDNGQYWTSTSITYFFATNYYAANLSDGTLNFFGNDHERKARCIRQ